jgi:arsenate reductase (glutaredoxin)
MHRDANLFRGRRHGLRLRWLLQDRHARAHTMAITVYHYPGCSTCRRALKWLDAQGIAHERVHIVEQPPKKTELTRALKTSGLALRALFNTSGQSYRDGNFKERLPALTEAQALDALANDGKLIKRPLLLGDDVTLVGFDEAAWKRALG